jgi:glycosyltransferase involved in cell wall biosynthesis
VDTQLFSPARRSPELRRSWGVPDDALVVACVGRLAAEKNLPVLVQAFEAIRRGHPQARLLLVGDGPLRAELAARVPQALLVGQRRGEDLAAHYASADLFLFPSLTETFGNVTTEAMASGLPVLAFDYAAAAQLIKPGHNGMLVPFGDTDEFVRTAVQLARSAARRHALGRGARERALAQDWSDIIARFEGVLVQAIERSPVMGGVAIPAPSAA